MIVRENRALFECIRERCKRTGIGVMLYFSNLTQLTITLCYYILNCYFATRPCARVCAGFAGDYSWSGSIEKNAPTSELINESTI